MNYKEFNGYRVYVNGDVIGKMYETPLKSRDCKGYLRVTLHYDGAPHTFQVHRLVAIVFLPNYYGLPTVDHKDRNKTNNNIYNLKWQSHRGQEINKDTSSRNTSGIKGVNWDKHNNRWVASIIMLSKKRIRKQFKSKEDAITQRLSWELLYYR